MSRLSPAFSFIALVTLLTAISIAFATVAVSDKDRDERVQSEPQIRLHKDPLSPLADLRDPTWDGKYLWDVPNNGNIACTIEHTEKHHGKGTSGATRGLGQTFTACSDGSVTRVVVEPFWTATPQATFGISNGDRRWAPVYTQAVVLNPSEQSLITLDVPFPVIEGDVYTFGLITPTGGELILWQGRNGYLGGDSVFLRGSRMIYSTPPGDLTFVLIIEADDDTPPTLSVELNPGVLWPPNHKLVDVHATITVTDDVDPDPSVVLSSITCSEMGSAAAGNCPDGFVEGADYGTADVDFRLRAERSGRSDGRLYEITYEAADASGNVAAATAYVTVPHDQRAARDLWRSSGDAVESPPSDRLVVQPNPFNPSTTIRFHLEDAGPVTLRVYDVNGALVRTLRNEILTSGIHEARWNGLDQHGTRASSGIYFIQLTVNGSTTTRKISLLK
jgi:hypothetical protein